MTRLTIQSIFLKDWQIKANRLIHVELDSCVYLLICEHTSLVSINQTQLQIDVAFDQINLIRGIHRC